MNKKTGEVLENKNNQNKGGAKAVHRTFNPGRKAQHWSFNQADEGYYAILILKSEKALEGENESILSGAEIQQGEYKQSTNQAWVLESLGDRAFRIVNRYSGKIFEKAGSSHEAVQGSYTGNEKQKWTIEGVIY